MGEVSKWLQDAISMAERKGKEPRNLRIIVQTEEGKKKKLN